MVMSKINTKSPEAVKYKKDCHDFVCLRDGTLYGDCRYCDRSLFCRQVSINMKGQLVPMEAHRLVIYDLLGEVEGESLFCTGMMDLRPLKERIEDDKVS